MILFLFVNIKIVTDFIVGVTTEFFIYIQRIS